MAGALLALFGMLLARERYCAWYYRISMPVKR